MNHAKGICHSIAFKDSVHDFSAGLKRSRNHSAMLFAFTFGLLILDSCKHIYFCAIICGHEKHMKASHEYFPNYWLGRKDQCSTSPISLQ